jgi:N-acetylmuramoyl-L-alanine amidase
VAFNGKGIAGFRTRVKVGETGVVQNPCFPIRHIPEMNPAMSHFLKFSFTLGLAAFFASCAAPSHVAPSSSGRDVLGHRPGPRGFTTVIIDAGHGGKDSGAVSHITGQKEKDLTLDMAKRLRSELSGDFKTILMRDDDTFVDLDERVIRANQYGGILVSLHFNDGPSNIRGPETYYWRVDSHGLAVRCQQAMNSVCPAKDNNRGMVRRRIRLTRNPEIPCLLLEGGYLSNAAESHLIADPAYRQKLAHAIAGAIRAQAANGDAGTGPLPPPLNAPMSRPTDTKE